MEEPSALSSSVTWQPHLGGERVVEGVHYGWLMKDHIARYHFASKYCRGMRVLDVATGTGYGANILRRNGAVEVVAVDREQAALDYAAQRYGTDGLHWMNSDAYSLPFDKEFDVVVSFETIEHLKEPERFIVEFKRAIKPSGMCIISTPENVGGQFVSDYHALEFSREEFRTLLQKHFPKVELLGQRRELSTMIRPLGSLPDWFFEAHAKYGHGHALFTIMDRINKLPNLALASLLGMGESFRERILPIDAPIKNSPLLKPHYYVLIGICRVD
jgi:2-polyprenyl-3-methyl-5-hydroxy-6-metoxy-1,4-benzoquinol methylase